MADFPGAGVPAGEECHDLFTVGLGGEIAFVLGHIAHKKSWVVEHHKVLLAGMLRALCQFFTGHIQQLDCHAAGIAGVVELRVGIAVGQAHPGLPGLAWFAEYTALQAAIDIGADGDFGLHAAMRLGVGIAQHAGIVAVLFDHADGIFNDALGERGFIGRDLLFSRHRAGELPAVIGGSDGPAADADSQYEHQ